MPHCDIILVGDGIAGACMALSLFEHNISFEWYASGIKSATTAASGIINPVSGLRFSSTFAYNEALPHALALYKKYDCLTQTSILDFFANPSAKEFFNKRINSPHLTSEEQTLTLSCIRKIPSSFGKIWPVHQVDIAKFYEQINFIPKKKETFSYHNLNLTEHGLIYRDIAAKKIIFCDGYNPSNPFTKQLAFKPNKGQALIIKCKGITTSFIIKDTYTIVPLGDDLFWIGASFEWQYEDEKPTASFLQEVTNWLQLFLNEPFEIVHHVAAVRPATADRVPLAGFLTKQAQIGILNGLGTKGLLWAPWLAYLMSNHILNGTPIPKEVDVNRNQAQLLNIG